MRDAEGGETTPSFGHPSNVRRAAKPPRPSETPPMFGGAEAALPLSGTELAKVPSKGLLSNLPISLLIGGKGGSPRPKALRARGTP